MGEESTLVHVSSPRHRPHPFGVKVITCDNMEVRLFIATLLLYHNLARLIITVICSRERQGICISSKNVVITYHRYGGACTARQIAMP